MVYFIDKKLIFGTLTNKNLYCYIPQGAPYGKNRYSPYSTTT